VRAQQGSCHASSQDTLTYLLFTLYCHHIGTTFHVTAAGCRCNNYIFVRDWTRRRHTEQRQTTCGRRAFSTSTKPGRAPTKPLTTCRCHRVTTRPKPCSRPHRHKRNGNPRSRLARMRRRLSMHERVAASCSVNQAWPQPSPVIRCLVQWSRPLGVVEGGVFVQFDPAVSVSIDPMKPPAQLHIERRFIRPQRAIPVGIEHANSRFGGDIGEYRLPRLACDLGRRLRTPSASSQGQSRNPGPTSQAYRLCLGRQSPVGGALPKVRRPARVRSNARCSHLVATSSEISRTVTPPRANRLSFASGLSITSPRQPSVPATIRKQDSDGRSLKLCNALNRRASAASLTENTVWPPTRGCPADCLQLACHARAPKCLAQALQDCRRTQNPRRCGRHNPNGGDS
jgi:hypothetical protein